MKLYATVTSERASKGQGGNERMEAIFTGEMADGTRRELFHSCIEPCAEGYRIDISDHWGNTIYSETYDDDTKGEKQKGDGRVPCDGKHKSTDDLFSCPDCEGLFR